MIFLLVFKAIIPMVNMTHTSNSLTTQKLSTRGYIVGFLCTGLWRNKSLGYATKLVVTCSCSSHFTVKSHCHKNTAADPFCFVKFCHLPNVTQKNQLRSKKAGCIEKETRVSKNWASHRQ